MKRKQISNKNRNQKKLASNLGMTMAEMMITVAIIVVLMAVAFIGLVAYQRMLAQVERDGIAKEIFIAAQNHLTLAKGQGYLGVAERAKKADEAGKEAMIGYLDAESGARYIVVNDGNASAEDMFDIMLPFGAIDETVRIGSSYVIKYQWETGMVLDVFYCSTGSEKFDYSLSQDDYTTDASGEYKKLNSYVDTYKADGTVQTDNRKDRRDRFREGKILGWYGGAAAAALQSTILKTPSIEVINGDTLCVKVKDNNSKNSDAKLKLIITGVTSKAKKGVVLDRTLSASDVRTDRIQHDDHDIYIYTIDDITTRDSNGKGLHFARLGQDTPDKAFIAGEDIRIEAVAYSLTKLANIEFSNEATENSLYDSIAKPKDVDNNLSFSDSSRYAYISSIRHLENLEELVSNAGCKTTETAQSSTSYANKSMTIVKAFQTADIDWESYTSRRPETEDPKLLRTGTIGNPDGKSVIEFDGTSAGGYYPVSYSTKIDYDGLRHSVSKIKTSDAFRDYAGLFGSAASGSTIKNLRLIDFSITGAGKVGALVGSAHSTKISNVVAYNEIPEGSTDDNPETATIIAESGDAGGLIGYMDGGDARYSAASLVVKGTDNAGGFIGAVYGNPTITACYSGGHTEEGEYYTHSNNGSRDEVLKNVEATAASGTAGGFIGNAATAVISDCYSTCSAWAKPQGSAGGFVGYAKGSIQHCYCTGLVGESESANNAFIGGGNASVQNDYFFESINGYKEEGSDSMSYKRPAPGEEIAEIKSIDTDETTYNDFISGENTWDDAAPYDGDIKDYYRGRYNLLTVTQLREITKGGNKARNEQKTDIGDQQYSLFVNTHYGDWPAPEVFFINNR